MPPAIETHRASSPQLGLAGVLLVGVLMLGYGYFQPNKVAFYAGLFVTLGGVITGAIRIVTHGSRGAADT